ncbi:hypothetical protein ACA910_008011 [Epithemia clementina (nom. ined.)]
MSSTTATTADAATATCSTANNTTTSSEAFQTLIQKWSTVAHLEKVSGLLNYDQMVHMPHAAGPERGAQMAALAAILHEKSTDPALLPLLEQAKQDLIRREEDTAADDDDNKDANKDALRLLELEYKEFVQNARVSTELASQKAALKAAAHAAWAQAREQADFAVFEPYLQQCFDLVQQEALAKLGDNPEQVAPYTHLLDQYEMGMAPERLNAVFDEIETALVPLIAKIAASSSSPSREPLQVPIRMETQKELSRQIVTQLGYKVECGRMDVSVHPFTMSLSPHDVRITSRYKVDDDWHNGLAANIHESGHAMYEQNLPTTKSTAFGGKGKGDGTAQLSIDTALSLGMHESQSLFWERHVGLSRPFWEWATPLVKQAVEQQSKTENSDNPTLFEFTPEQVYRAVNAVRPQCLIRVEADELAYPLHVILRYRLERDVLQGTLAVADIPQRWNAQMKELLGIDSIPSNAVGCLQDIHWSMMAIGYFPTYLVGSATAAQLAHYCRRDLPHFHDLVAQGNFAPIREWLTHKVHRHGKRYKSLDALLQGELGEPLNPQYFIEYLTNKYTELYP